MVLFRLCCVLLFLICPFVFGDNTAHPVTTSSNEVSYVAITIRVVRFYLGVAVSSVRMAGNAARVAVRVAGRVVDPAFRREVVATWARFNPPTPQSVRVDGTPVEQVWDTLNTWAHNPQCRSRDFRPNRSGARAFSNEEWDAMDLTEADLEGMPDLIPAPSPEEVPASAGDVISEGSSVSSVTPTQSSRSSFVAPAQALSGSSPTPVPVPQASSVATPVASTSRGGVRVVTGRADPQYSKTNSWYAVTTGRKVGVFFSWHNTAPHVSGCTDHKYAKFATKEQAEKHFADVLGDNDVVQMVDG